MVATRHGHIGIGLRYLVSRIQEAGNGRGIVAGPDGKPLSDAAAIAWLEHQIADGKRVACDCPTPLPDGSCPGHDGPG